MYLPSVSIVTVPLTGCLSTVYTSTSLSGSSMLRSPVTTLAESWPMRAGLSVGVWLKRKVRIGLPVAAAVALAMAATTPGSRRAAAATAQLSGDSTGLAGCSGPVPASAAASDRIAPVIAGVAAIARETSATRRTGAVIAAITGADSGTTARGVAAAAGVRSVVARGSTRSTGSRTAAARRAG